ncbi:MAG: RDD family protein [Acidobacteriota bacterium]
MAKRRRGSKRQKAPEHQEILFDAEDLPMGRDVEDVPPRADGFVDELDEIPPNPFDELANPPRRRNTSQQIPLRVAIPAGLDDTERSAPVVDRLIAGAIDFSVHLIAVGLALAAAWSLGVPLEPSIWPPFLAFALVFSFVYWTVPLAFWGQTPGMAIRAHQARNHDDEPLTFEQTILRWVGALLTVVFAGLPILIAATGRSLSDRLSETKTIRH